MSRIKPAAKLDFQPPGPGYWLLESLHYPRPVTRYLQETQPEPYKRGTSNFARFFGLLNDGEEIGFVNGFAYVQELRVPATEILERYERAEQVIAQTLWREQLRDWDEKIKPLSIAKHKKLQAVNPDKLSDAELVTHLKRCRDHHAAMIAQHHRFTGSSLIPIGDFLLQVVEWTGLKPSEILEVTRGSAVHSAGSSDELKRLKEALARDSVARDYLELSDEPASVLEILRSFKGETGAAVSDYLDLVGTRIIDGFDICEPMALEVPGALLGAIRSAVFSEAESYFDFTESIGDIRAKVPAAHKAAFNELLGEVRLIYRLRDERGIYSDIWAAGLMRRAALAAGGRVAERGRISSAQLMVDATVDEMCALLLGSEGPTSEELSKRAEYRTTHSFKDAPRSLGAPKPQPVDLAKLPPPAARIMRAYFIGMKQQFEALQVRNEEKILHGFAASKGVYEGPIRIVASSHDFAHIVQGDVLVTESTSEAFNILIPLLGAIITDNGGLLSHAAIVSREYGIPGVVGTRDATKRLADGVRVRVDGDTGDVTVIE